MKAGSLKLKGGKASANDACTGSYGEITVDTTGKCLRVHDGKTAGGAATVPAADVPANVSDISNETIRTKENLSKLSDLTDDVGYWAKSALTEISQLENDAGYLTGHCTHCTYCSYCTDCT